jgi:hypothetical protein
MAFFWLSNFVKFARTYVTVLNYYKNALKIITKFYKLFEELYLNYTF